jgi:outer membrane biosynthesis protein TonB
LRIRIALSLGALVLAGGALTGGIALASEAQPPAPTATTRPTEPPSAIPTTSRKPTKAPTAVPAPPREATKAPSARPQRVPVAVPAGPTGDLHLPAIGVTR